MCCTDNSKNGIKENGRYPKSDLLILRSLVTYSAVYSWSLRSTRRSRWLHSTRRPRRGEVHGRRDESSIWGLHRGRLVDYANSTAAHVRS